MAAPITNAERTQYGSNAIRKISTMIAATYHR